MFSPKNFFTALVFFTDFSKKLIEAGRFFDRFSILAWFALHLHPTKNVHNFGDFRRITMKFGEIRWL
jgi:hypothetical protein